MNYNARRYLANVQWKTIAGPEQQFHRGPAAQPDSPQTGRKIRKEKRAKPLRGVETLFRTTSHNQMSLGKIADNKAHLMIQVNAIVVSVVVSVLMRKFDQFPNLILPTMVLVAFSLAAIVYAILAARPHLTPGRFTVEEVQSNQTNLLYFGNFYRMPLTDYEAAMKILRQDSDLLYGNLIRDQYSLGKVLGTKYRYIRISYTIFMFGFILSVLCFAVAIVFFPVQQQ